MKSRRTGRRGAFFSLVFLAFALLIHEVGAQVLAELGVVEQLLSAGGAGSIIVLLLSMIFMVLRLFLYFVAPGLVLIDVYKLIRGRRNREAAVLERR